MAEDHRGITAASFYGSSLSDIRQSERYIRIRATEQRLKLKPVALHPVPGLFGIPSTWISYPSQAKALAHCARSNHELRTFAFETSKSGQRCFLVSHPSYFWNIYAQRNASERHYYEVIPEFVPCNLYVDLEFYTAWNPNRDGARMVKTVTKLIQYHVKDQFCLDVSDQAFIELTATTTKKFSCHLILNLPGIAFENNYAVGRFMKLVHDSIQLSQSVDDITADELKELMVKKGEDEVTCFIDLCVYTKNRNFRVYLSSKLGQENPLKLSGTNQKMKSERATFLASLVTVPHKENLQLLCQDTFEIEELRPMGGPSLRSLQRSCKNPSAIFHDKISEFVEREVYPGRIRRRLDISECNKIVFEIDSGHRYCANVGRDHKHNHVKIVVDTLLKSFYQKCFDPDCRGFSSQMKPLPDNVCEKSDDLSEEELLMICAAIEDTISGCECAENIF